MVWWLQNNWKRPCVSRSKCCRLLHWAAQSQDVNRKVDVYQGWNGSLWEQWQARSHDGTSLPISDVCATNKCRSRACFLRSWRSLHHKAAIQSRWHHARLPLYYKFTPPVNCISYGIMGTRSRSLTLNCFLLTLTQTVSFVISEWLVDLLLITW